MIPSVRKGKELQDIETAFRKLDFFSNFNCNTVTLKDIGPGNFSFPHGLKATPSGRIIIQQIGGGLIVDAGRGWDDKYVYMHNDGGIISKLKIIILR